ncbi:hypothetical protein ACPXCE_27345 [Streptomyces sp. DT24]|uniref:hypothetical protein n=1 Tax=unclassified Streptomyces TaxID=2593676 RepID=UPI0023BA0C0C|nr:hypothetical protein [Streptomyces sp. AM 4-1-1]WEH34781.1 hypothetical protein PZB75_16335 [Streptomyces sp. AM 4-1-1]
MRQPTAAFAVTLTTALVLVLSGCDSAPVDTTANPTAPAPATSDPNAPARTTPAPADPSPADPSPQGGPPTGPAGRSLWTLIDDKGATIATLPDDDADVVAVRKTVALHSVTTDNRDHRSIADSTENEFTFYAPEFVQVLKGQGYGAQLATLFRGNQLTTRQVKTAWYRSTIYKDRATAKADMDTVIEFTAAAPGYLKKGGFALNTPYTQHRTVSLAKRDGQWKITAIQKSPMVKDASRPASS